MAVLDPTVSARREWREAGRMLLAALSWLLYAAGWATAKALRSVGWLAAAGLFGVGWLAARMVWPGLRWCGRAVVLGWDEGRRPGFKR